MKKIFYALTLMVLLLTFRILSGQPTDCQKQCQEQLKNCKSHCLTMGADNTGCDERCIKENTRCLAKCETVKPDNKATDNDDADVEDDADYNDDSLDDDSEFED